MENRPISPAEPIKKRPPLIQPNAHPYAVKTTSSAVLSRSNSSPHSAHHTRHHYVPSSRIPTGTRVRHHHSSSLPSVEAKVQCEVRTVPMPLPTPPSIVVALPDNPSVSLKRADEPRLTQRVRRAETMPSSSATAAITRHHSYDQKHKYSRDQDFGPELYAALPPNPKQWNTDELATYLETSLMSGNNIDGDRDDSLVDILDCVRTRGLTGRELLRLTDADLVGTPLSDVQRAQLLERSRIFRADVLRGRIYVDSYHSHEVSDNSNDIYSRSARSSTPFHSVRGASVSVDDLRLLIDNNTDVDEGAFPPSPAMSLHRSNSDASAQRYRDLACMRMRRRGRVKGLVETWERASTSGSECSASEEGSVGGSEAESESETDPEFESMLDVKRSPESPSDLPSALHDEPPHDVRSSTANSMIVLQEPPSLTPPPPYTHMYTELGVLGDGEEEPSIEELLASSSSIPLRGARAWEADLGLGETVKRIPTSTSADAGGASPFLMEADTPRTKNEGGQTREDSVRFKQSGVRGSTRSRGKNAKTQKRVVTAIFTGSPSDDISENIGDTTILVDHRFASGVGGLVRDNAPVRSDLQNDSDSALRALEESIVATRAQVEAFRLRLDAVEADTAKREVELDRAQYSGPRHSSEFELRRRRSEANEEATPDTAELLSDETVSEGPRNGDGLGDWETMSMGDIVRRIVARAMGCVFPYGHVAAPACADQDRSHARTGSHPGVNDRYPFPAKGSGRLSVARMSCSVIFFSFAICAAVLRRIGFGRWVRRP